VVIPPVLVNMPNDTALCPGEYITVYSPNTDRFVWSDGTNGSRLYPKYSGIYTLTASNYCYSLDSTVLIELLDCDNDIYIPNAFTPNGNGLNEVFKPVFSRSEYLEEYKFYIYNRWGNLLYYTTDIYDSWTGYGCDEGVYVYIIEYKNKRKKQQHLTGTVALIR
jgi:gliding motility-associated-like protein